MNSDSDTIRAADIIAIDHGIGVCSYLPGYECPSCRARAALSRVEARLAALERVVDNLRFAPGDDCWCSARPVDSPEWHSDECLRTRAVLDAQRETGQ